MRHDFESRVWGYWLTDRWGEHALRIMRGTGEEWGGEANVREGGGGDGVALGGGWSPEQQGAPALAVGVVVGVRLDATGGDVDLLRLGPPLLTQSSIEDGVSMDRRSARRGDVKTQKKKSLEKESR